MLGLSHNKGGETMKERILVSETSDGKWQVLINFIRIGVAYTSKEVAEKEKAKLCAQQKA